MTTKTAIAATVLLLAAGVAACDGPRVGPVGQSSADTSAPLDAPAVSPPPPPEGAFLGQMSPTQTSQLTSLGVDVIVPGQVPPSFSVVEMRVDHCLLYTS
ncbi:hypothetical protein C7293_19715, partial [filamentous cyanobacterium CCT1]